MSERAARQRQHVLRVAFLALLAGGLLLWAHLRAPRQLELVVDLTDALPGEVTQLDVVVLRHGQALLRSDRRYGKEGAPQRVRVEVRARPGPAEVEATLVYAGRPAQRWQRTLELREGQAATLQAR
jgi:hypothetical protein